jgi:glycine dehydrogenase
MLAEGLRRQGHTMDDNVVFDTVRVTPKGDREDILRRAKDKRINIRQLDDGSFGVSLDETVTIDDLKDLLYIFGNLQITDNYIQELLNISSQGSISNSKFARTSKFLEHPVFNSYHSETELTRYMKRLENLDLSLTHSMIPLGSCTMKLNPTSALLPISMPEFNSLHPFVPSDQTRGYQEMLEELEAHLCDITGYDKFSFQPNSGAQGEYAGLCAIMEYFKDRGETQKNICLIPDSAHGTNPASAVMAGLEVVEIPTKDGEISLDIIKAKIEQYSDRLAALMITYPSTSGVFDDTVKEICDMVHHYGGQVYVDGANLNAQVGLCRIADYGGDVSHLNLHKTFCIPHGGGGPGMGPIGV